MKVKILHLSDKKIKYTNIVSDFDTSANWEFKTS